MSDPGPSWPACFIFCHLTLLHSEWPKLYGVLAVLSVNGLKTLLHSEWPKLYAECKRVKEVWCGDINCKHSDIIDKQ